MTRQSGDGRCIFDIVMKGTAPSETTTGRDIARAAWILLNECVRDHGSQGGVVSNIGKDILTKAKRVNFIRRLFFLLGYLLIVTRAKRNIRNHTSLLRPCFHPMW